MVGRRRSGAAVRQRLVEANHQARARNAPDQSMRDGRRFTAAPDEAGRIPRRFP